MANSKPAVLSSAAPCSPPALAAQRWGWLEQGLPKAEHDECRRLMVKAIMAGESEKIMDEALTEFRGLRSRLQLNGEWNHVLTFYGRGPGPETRKRVLEAQSSRALVEHNMDEEPGDGWAKVSLEEDDVDSQDFDELFASPFSISFDEVLENDVSSGNRKQKAKPKPSPEGLPPDVKNLTEWGSTIIQFGKFRNSNLTYEVRHQGNQLLQGLGGQPHWADNWPMPRLGPVPEGLHRRRLWFQAKRDPRHHPGAQVQGKLQCLFVRLQACSSYHTPDEVIIVFVYCTPLPDLLLLVCQLHDSFSSFHISHLLIL